MSPPYAPAEVPLAPGPWPPSAQASRDVVVVIGDVVGSRRAADRAALHLRLAEALSTAGAQARTPFVITNGDEFQATFTTLGAALDATCRLRLSLLPHVDVRFGLGRGPLSLTGTPDGTEDGAGWWAARSAIQTVHEQATRPGLRHTRALMASAPGAAPQEAYAVSAALRCQDHLMGSLDARSLHILRGLFMGRTQLELADELEISASAVSQRTTAHGLSMLMRSIDDLRALL